MRGRVHGIQNKTTFGHEQSQGGTSRMADPVCVCGRSPRGPEAPQQVKSCEPSGTTVQSTPDPLSLRLPGCPLPAEEAETLLPE